jgi:glycosyltransferase involved in cell wall biosynthesis
VSAVDVSVVIPCLDEARSIEICVEKALQAMAEHGIAGEVIVADNGSRDGSQQLARDAGARVVHAERRGYGNALRAGIDAAAGEFIVMGDADDSYDFAQLHRFVEKWREGYDVVMGNRFAGGIRPGAMPWLHRYVGNPVLSGLLNVLFRSGIKDAHCGMRGFTKSVYERMDLRTTGMEFASEFVIKAARLRASITEIPIVLWPDRRGRPPHLRSVPDGRRHLRLMLLYSPSWLFLAPGAVLSLIGVVLVLWLLPGPRAVGDVVFDVHTMFFGMVFAILGVQVVSIGLFARVFSYSERFAREGRSFERLLRSVSLEQGLLLGFVLFLAGFAGEAHVLWEWRNEGFGPFSALREVIFWSLPLFVGLQTIFSSFFLSMLGISRDTYIGDYELRTDVSRGASDDA